MHKGLDEDEHFLLAEVASDFLKPWPQAEIVGRLRERATAQATAEDVAKFHRVADVVEKMTATELDAAIHSYW